MAKDAGSPSKAQERTARQAAALRANLAKRKAQQRARKAGEPDPAPLDATVEQRTDASSDDPDDGLSDS